MKKLSLLSALGLAIFAMSCAKDTNKSQVQAPLKTVNISYVTAPLNVPLIVAKNKDIFQKAFAAGPSPQNVRFYEMTTGPQQTEALASGSLDFASVLGATSAILSAANGSGLRIIGIFSRAPKAFVMETMAHDINTLADLKGKKIGGPKGTILHQLLLAALQKAGLKMNDVEFVSMMLPEALTAMTGGQIDVALLAGASMMEGLNQGARILTTGEGLVEGTTVIATRQEIIDNHPDVVETYLNAQRESVKTMVDNWEESIQLTATELGIPAQEVAKAINLYDFDMIIKPSDKRELAKTRDFLIANGLLEQTMAIDDMIVEDWFKKKDSNHPEHADHPGHSDNE